MNRRRTLVTAVVLAVLASALVVPVAQAKEAKAGYIVVLEDSVARPAAVAARHGKALGLKADRLYRHAFKGYSTKLSRKQVRVLRSDPKVAFVERDRIASIADHKPRHKPPSGGDGDSAGVGSWGLDRSDDIPLVLDGSYEVKNNGNGVIAYVLDTGIRTSHKEFSGRASDGWDFIDGDSTAQDCHGHGTHVAGTIGGKTYGIATGVQLKGVRVLNCAGFGSWSVIASAIDWVAGRKTTNDQPTVINMSIGGPKSAAVDVAIAGATAKGVTVVVAAGNEGSNACNYSPASSPTAITVGATTKTDARASYSNRGTCVDLFAPGSGIKSAWRNKNNATKTLSGTSMASPHVAGAAALFLQGNREASPATVLDKLTLTHTDSEGHGNWGKLSGIGIGSPNILLYVGKL